MVAADHDRSGQLAARHEVVERHAELRAVALAEPADARGEPLKVHLLARERDPPRELRVVREELENQLVGAVEILGIAGERDPAKWSLPLAEQRAHDAGLAHAFDFPGFVPAYVRPLFCEGKGPFRWVALSGDPKDLYR